MSLKGNVLGPHDEHMFIKKKGIMDLQKLYADVRKWFVDNQYEFHETDHKTKAPTPIGTEEEIKIVAWRNEDDFTRWQIHLDFNIWDSSPVQVMRNGKPVTMFKCRIKIQIDPWFVFDYENRWERSLFLQGLFNFYRKEIIKRRIDIEGDKFEYEFHELHDLMKRDVSIDAAGDQFAHFWN